MNCLPVIEREMRSASRRGWSFGFRLLFAGAGGAACLVILAIPNLSSAQKGRTMLTVLSFLTLAFCLLVGGFLTADCVSSEKRDGTLGLLFLTPLAGLDVVVGKMVCHGLQIFYGLCAVCPVFFLPLLVGGVTWGEVTRIVLALGVALLLSGSAGMLVSVLGTESRKTILATLATVGLIAAIPMLLLFVQETLLAIRGAKMGLFQFSPVFTVLAGFDSSYGRRGGPILFWGSAIILSGLSLLFVLLSGALAGRVFQTVTPNQSAVKKHQLDSPALLGLLERNPCEWMTLRTARDAGSVGILAHILTPFFAVMLVVSVTTPHWQAGFCGAFFAALAIHIVAKLRLAVEATRQISMDRQSGALELLLVTALPEESVLIGYQRGLGKIARKPLILLFVLNALLELWVLLFPRQLRMDFHSSAMFTLLFVGGMSLAAADFYTLRWLALLKGLLAPSHVKAALLTFSLTMLGPWTAFGLMVAWLSSVQSSQNSFELAFLSWLSFSLIYDLLILRRVRRRLQGTWRRLASEGP
jgi:ABC-type transport system involved in cytochrome c biogenesis permease component